MVWTRVLLSNCCIFPMTKIDDTYQIRSFTFTMCPWQVLLLKKIPSNFLSATYSSSNYHHIVGQFSHGEKPDSKLKVAFDIFAPSRILFMLKRVKKSSILFYWAPEQDSTMLRHTIILNLPFTNLSVCIVENWPAHNMLALLLQFLCLPMNT